MPLRRLLALAERFSESAILLGFVDLKTSGSRSRALLRCVTRADHRWFFDDLFRNRAMSNSNVSHLSSHDDAAFALVHDLESEPLVETHGRIFRRGADGDR